MVKNIILICRVLVINWEDMSSYDYVDLLSEHNLTQNRIISSALTHWIMIEKFYTEETWNVYQYNLTSSMFNARKMKAFQWSNSFLISIDEQILNWNKLQYFKLYDTISLLSLPNHFDKLTEGRPKLDQSI